MENNLPNRERLKIKRQPMPEQDPIIRAANFNEVNLGFSKEAALQEALRCLQCPKPTCIEGCPVNIKIPEFINLIVKEDFAGAVAKIKEDNSLPAVCGRVCPQEEQCEAKCILDKRFEAVSIGRLERFVADWERESGQFQVPEKAPETGRKIAIIGSGPSGLACATDLAIMGHDVTVFEALHEFGGVLVYGIPEFRLPKHILKVEIDNLKNLGVKFVKNFIAGRIATLNELFTEGFEAIFVGVGAGLPWFMNIPGENLNGVYSANEFLTRVNLMRAYDFPNWDTPIQIGKNVAVIGGGNTAMDAVRTAKRLGAKRAMIFYRRSEAEMPARIEEVHHAKEEGVEFHTLVSPIRYEGDENGWVKKAVSVRMELGEPDASGRRRPVLIPDSEFEMEIDQVVVAIGNGSNPIIGQTTPDLTLNSWGNIVVEESSGKTSKRGVFAGGDIVTGGATVILAMGAGRKAAKAIQKYLENNEW
ncbi:MAG TPA: NADPH-dependent glutamate synthase [Candidatus Marinimicrobia bacterium]|nr:NADPH-dependent glutamate synthase [Candidatus Neomarinimicrobiota bacterium]